MLPPPPPLEIRLPTVALPETDNVVPRKVLAEITLALLMLPPEPPAVIKLPTVALPVTDNTPQTDWTYGWSNFDPENTNYPTTQTTVSTDITTNTTWSGVIKLQNKVYVKNGATLTILPGTIIRGDYATQGTLIVTRGSKLIADGEQFNPIVFTSNNPIQQRTGGDWGGVGAWQQMVEWCVETYGPSAKDGAWTLGMRWYVNNAKFWFRDKEDMAYFILRWS